MSSLPKTRHSAEDYLALDRAADCKSEFVDGEIFAMVGASPRHVLIAANIVGELRNRLKHTNCQVYAADLRIQAEARSRYHYPDVAVVCGRPDYTDGLKDTVANPLVIVEVLSPSTQSYDRGDKFASYRRLASLKEYLLVGQQPCHVERFSRKGAVWEFSEMDDCAGELAIPALGIAVPLAEIYAKVEWLEDGAEA